MTPFDVRPATSADLAAIDAVHRAAFPSKLEARLVALLIERGKATISLVAEINGQVAGHILFSPATVGSTGPVGPELQTDSELPNPGLGLAPVVVLPAFQNQGLGSALIHAGLAECRRLATVGLAGPTGWRSEIGGQKSEESESNSDSRLPTSVHWVVVLGHQTYYPRFGFAPASRWNLTCDYGDSDAFQFLPLTAAANEIRGGHIRYASEFAEVFPDE